MRKVRTPEGSRYYGLPIGSPITADAIARAKARGGKAPGVTEVSPEQKARGTKGEAAPQSAARAVGAPSTSTRVFSVGKKTYNVPPDTTLKASPTGRDDVYAISPDESVRLLTGDGAVLLDDAMADRVLDLLSRPGDDADRDAESDGGAKATGESPNDAARDEAAPAAPPAQAPAADADQAPVGNGNWNPTSMGTSVHERTPADIEEFRHSKITGPHLNPDGTFTAERQALHDEIITRFLDGLPTKDKPTQFMNGGGPASGKSSMTSGANAGVLNYPAVRTANELTGEFDPEADAPEALLLDADSIKMQLPEVREALARFRDGSATPEDSAWAGDSHAESSYLSERLHRAALERGHDVVFDGTGNGNIETMRARVQAAKDLGYRVEANYLFAEPTTGIERAAERAKRSSRAVPEAVIRAIYTKIPPIFEALKDEGIFDTLRLFDNNGGMGDPARLIAESDGTDFKVHDAQAYVNFLSSAHRTDATRFSAAAQEKVAGVQQVEPVLTDTVMTSVAASGGQVQDVLITPPDQIDALLRVRAAERGQTPEEAAAEMADALTYNVIAPDENYAQVVEKALADLQAQNVRIEAMLNRFETGGAGVAVIGRTPEGARFQVEFQTPQSSEISEQTMGLFRQIQSMPAGSPERAVFDAALRATSGGATAPATMPALATNLK